MKGLLKVSLIVASLLVAHAVCADLPEGTTIEDYLPTMTGNTIEAGGVIYSFENAEEFEVEDSKWKFKGDMATTNELGIFTLEELEFDPDPTVFLSQLVENNTASAQTYVLYIDQPAYLASSSSTTYGSVTLSLLDIAGDGASLTDNGTSIYKAFIDGNQAGTLMDPTYSLGTPPGTVDSGSEYFLGSYPAGVVSDIGIQIEFTLSAGDRATVQSRFDVIPEPASMVLLVATSSAIVFVRRRFMA